MDTTIGNDGLLDKMRQAHTRRLAVAMKDKFREGMLDLAREGGIVPNAQLIQMCEEFGARCADVMMAEMAVVQTRMKVTPDDVPPALRAGTTQEIINEVVKPAMATTIADAIMSAGLATPTLAIPPSMGAMPIFASWTFALREQSGPAAMPNAPRLDYGKGTSVFPRVGEKPASPSAETKAKPSRILLPGLGR